MSRMASNNLRLSSTLPSDLLASVVVFLIALPLCLGIALASHAPLFAGVVSGIIGGIVIGMFSGSHTSVSGPSAGSTAIVAAQIATLGSFEAFLLAGMIAGLIQIAMGLVRAGGLSAFIPTSVIKGMLAAIGVILVLKQIPHLFGHDTDPEGEMSFIQPDHQNTLSEFVALFADFHLGASVVGLLSIFVLVAWDNIKVLKKSVVPVSILVVVLGVVLQVLFRSYGSRWAISSTHLVQVPVAASFSAMSGFLRTPDFSQWTNPAIYSVAMAVAAVTSLETLLNIEAVDKLDPKQRVSPPNRELIAQGIGNVVNGLIGGIPATSVIVRSSVNINAGGQTKLSAILHGCLLLFCVIMLPTYLNMIPLSCLAAILIFTGFKLVSPELIKRMWDEGWSQFIPFMVTMVGIVFSDLITGVTLGMMTSISFILNSNLRRPLRRIVERHLGGDVLRIELANQVSFLNRAALDRALDEIPPGGHVLLDAHSTNYIDPDVLGMIQEFKEKTAPARGVQVSLTGFRKVYQLADEIQYVDHSTRELQEQLTSQQVLQILQEGNTRFRTGRRLTRDFERQMHATAEGQHPLAVVLSCIDSRTPSELIFDLGLGDIFSVRVAGNVTSAKVLGSMEYGTAVVGAKLILVMGHTRCGAVTAAVRLACSGEDIELATGCQHLEPIVAEIQPAIDMDSCMRMGSWSKSEVEAFADLVAKKNVINAVNRILEQSNTIRRLVDEGRVAVVGALYDVATGQIEFLTDGNWDLAAGGRENSATVARQEA